MPPFAFQTCEVSKTSYLQAVFCYLNICYLYLYFIYYQPMKRTTLLFIILPLLFLCKKGSGQMVSPFLLEGNLTGNVLSVTQLTYIIQEKRDKIKKIDSSTKYITKYDEDGNITEVSYYRNLPMTKGFQYISKAIYITKYDDKGNKAQTIWHSVNPDDTTRYNVAGIIKYNENGSFKEKKWRNMTSGDKGFTIYNDAGQVIEDRTNFVDGRLHCKTLYSYNNNYSKDNYLAVDSIYQVDGPLETVQTSRYDGKNNMVESDDFSVTQGKNRKTTYKYSDYDVKGNWIKRVTYGYIKDKAQAFSLTEREIKYYK